MKISTLDCVCKKPSDLSEVCRWIHQIKTSRTVVLLHGDLGAGKTELVRQYLGALGSKDVMSPTFSMINRYETKELKVFHVDLYRSESEEEIESSGFWEIFSEEEGILFLEWPERLGPSTFDSRWKKISVHIRANPDDSRSIAAVAT
jgi:tRNA threonylcarbamoyladenosine biosynthesis protein TsaE